MKKSLILQSIALIIGVLVVAGLSVFAWYALTNPSTGDIVVTINDSLRLELNFYRSQDGVTYTEVAANDVVNFVGGDNPESLIPGTKIYCRIDIRNLGDDTVNVGVRANGVSALYDDNSGDKPMTDEQLTLLEDDFTLDYGVGTENARPSTLTNIRFIAALKGGNTSYAMAQAVSIAPLSTAYVYIDYTLSSAFEGLGGVFTLKATGLEVG